MKRSILAAVTLQFVLSWLPREAAADVSLATDGRAVQEIVVTANAAEATRATAAILADYLQRISGAKFAIRDGDGQTGIAIGLLNDFPSLKLGVEFDPTAVDKREDYLLRSHSHGVWIIGATDQALRHAVWDLLHRLGYRQFFPGPHWEIIPQRPQLMIDADAFEHPSYYSRRIWYGYGAWDHAREPYRDWCEKNRCVEGIRLNTGHAYDGILARNKAAFAAHPEYLGLVAGERRSTKFCISNPGLRQLVVDDARKQFADDPTKQSVSVDPSDGGGWCQCAECAKLGSVTDRALTLANAVAEGVTQKYPDKYVGMYAYNEHSPPPSIQAHPRVVISVATAFIHGGYTVDQLLKGWAKRASILGIREYYSVSTWDRDLPGAARGGRLEYLRTTIPHFHEKSARFLSAESSDNWGPNGLGYYLASRMLWDVHEADRTDAAVVEFLELCFGPAREPMKKFYALLDGAKRYPLCDDLVGRMYRLLDEARGLTKDSAVLTRLDDLTLYVRYVELWLDYSTTAGAERQTVFEAVIRHAYRMRGTMLIHSLAIYRDVDSRDKSVSIPDDAKFNVPEGKNPWKSSEPFSRAELDRIRSEGIARRPLLDFTPVSFSSELIPAAPLKLISSKPGSMGIYSRSPRSYFTWVEKSPKTWQGMVTAGTVYRDRGVTKLELYPLAEAEGKSVAPAEVAPTRTPEMVILTSNFTGLHRLEILAGGGAQTTWSDGVPMTIESSFERPGDFHGRWTLYFYVPKGTKTVGGFSEGEGKLRIGADVLVHTFNRKPGFFNVPVPEGQDGRLWRFEGCAGDKMLMTVPPFLARSAAELLLPREVVECDTVR